MQLTTTFLSVDLSLVATVHGASVDSYTTHEGTCNGSASHQDRNIGCNSCVDPPGDWWGVQVFDIGGDICVTVHNQNNCTPSSQVGQWYGGICAATGGTALLSVWVACPGNRVLNNATASTDADKVTIVSWIKQRIS